VKPAASASDIEASKRNDAFWLDDARMKGDAVKRLKAVLASLRAQGIPVLVCEGFRSAERQRLLFCRNRTKEELLQAGYKEKEIDDARKLGHDEKAPVAANTWEWSSEKGHGAGTAIDVRWLWKGKVKPSLPWETWEKPMRRTIVDVHGCKWGGDWVLKGGKRDHGHIEYVERGKPQ
jgi:hypothetical protein